MAPLLTKTAGLKFSKSLRKQIKNIDFTPFSWVENEDDLQVAVSEIS